MNQESQQKNSSHGGSLNKSVNWRYWFVVCGFTAFVALLLLQEHRAHLWGMALYLILILCPLMLLVIRREDKKLHRQLDKMVDDNKDKKL